MSLRILPRALLYIVVVAILIRLLSLFYVVAFGVGEEGLIYGDAIGYVELATNLANGEGFVQIDPSTGEKVIQVFRAVGLPLLLAPFTLIPHGMIWWGMLLSIVAGFALPVCTYRIGEMLFDKRVALFAAALVAFEPHMVWFSWLPLSEMPFMVSALVGLYCALRSWEKGTRWHLGIAGALLGYAILIRPPFQPIILILLAISAGWTAYQNRKLSRQVIFVLLGIVLVLAPWSIRNFSHTGSFAISGMGWYNVYFDITSSIRAIEKGSDFSTEKRILESNPPQGIPVSEIQNPAYGAVLKNEALREMWLHRATFVKLETMLMMTFFTNDSYYYYLRRFGVLEEKSQGLTNRSATLALLSKGSGAISHVVLELKRQLFLPLIGRMFLLGVFLLALIGVFEYRREACVWLFVCAIALTALVSTAIGLGVEARLRVPIQPLLFLLAAAGISRVLWVYAYVRTRITTLRPRL